MTEQLITVYGGSGFVGRHLIRRLAKTGARVRAAVRQPNLAGYLKPMGDVGQIAPVQANIRYENSLIRALEGADRVVNLIGILHETGPQKFDIVQVQGAGAIARAAKAAGVRKLVHVSAIGADENSPSHYARSKALGEALVREHFPSATIIRPSVIFGPEDNFFNRFAAMARLLPMLPLIGGGKTRFQPVYVGDVAAAIQRALNDPSTDGKTYELGGPRVYNFKELLQLVLAETGRRRLLAPLPFWVARLQAWFLQLLPHPLLTVDQVRLLEHDNVVSDGALTLSDLGVTQPSSVELILPTYLQRYRRTGQFQSRHV